MAAFFCGPSRILGIVAMVMFGQFLSECCYWQKLCSINCAGFLSGSSVARCPWPSTCSLHLHRHAASRHATSSFKAASHIAWLHLQDLASRVSQATQ